MGKIQKLPESLVRLIAAGEVIERPASVVKELVENSLDAGATQISVDLWSAGRTRIRVSDDGEGMTREDAELALDRHATSKLHAFADLQHLSTFGFRGEALPSIAAVSRMELATRTRDSDQGWSLKLEGGQLLSSQATGLPPGTTLDVQDLFFNTPARAKFLKRDSTERSHLLKTIQEIALAHPRVGFTVSMDGKDLLSLVRTPELGQRIADLWGLSITEQLVPVQIAQGSCSIRGFVNAIPAHHPTKAYQVLYVNQRPVQQRMLNHALYQVYREWLPVGRHPVYCLFVDLDPAWVDANVHPTKREVRLSNESAIHELLYARVRDLLSRTADSVPSLRGGHPFSTTGKADEAILPMGTLRLPRPASLFKEKEAGLAMTLELQAPLLADSKPAELSFTDLRYLGQFQKLYLLFEQGDELVLVDQHAAAERILYEKLLVQVSTRDVPRQALLEPVLWDVSPAQAETVRGFLPELEVMGFGLESFGPQSFALKEWPVVLPETTQAQRFLEEVLEAFQDEIPSDRTRIQHEIAARAACRAAVMANDPLSASEAARLLEDLSACERPMTCPHGRPTHIRLPLSELHRRFKRT
jgi:DNA mismatch repair protein MutL